MADPGELEREVEALRERLSRLSEASLRINESLDFEVVLQGALDSARALTNAKYGVITLLNDAGEIEDFLSSGLTAAETQRVWETPGGKDLFDYLNNFSAPLRLPNVRAHLKALGLTHPRLPEDARSAPSFLAAPIRHGGERVGNVFLAQKEPAREFTDEDEETLVMFAAQAALVISNARRYREEQRARANLEALVDTSPIGVGVFDAGTGMPVSFNREARRMLDALGAPDQSPEQILGAVTVRRGDGREASLADPSTLPALNTGETLRAEELTLYVPDGRSMTLLVNVTPISSAEDGRVESFVVTAQDLAQLEELERLRAEFLGMVSHELRAPLASIKGSAATVLGAASAFGPAEMEQFFRIIDRQADQMSGLINDLLDVARIETGALPVAPSPAEVVSLVDEARSAFLSAGGRGNIRLDLPPAMPRVLADRRRVAQVLGNLLSNAARHAPSDSPIRVSAAHEGVHVAFSVADQGEGIPPDVLPHLFRKFSQAGSGRGGAGEGSGLGLAISKGIVEAHGGRIWAESGGAGRGARFTFTLPLADEDWRPAPVRAARGPRAPQRQSDRARILVVDDDPQTLRYVRELLSEAGFAPTVTTDPEQALSLMTEQRPDLVLLDLMLPGANGIDLMKDLLDVASVPVIFLSAYGQEEVVTKAFDSGADDYVIKPFSATELTARIRAVLRRRSAADQEPSEPYVHGDLTIDYAARRVMVAGAPVRLTAIEYRLLAELSAHAGRVLTYEHLLQRVWGLRKGADLRPMRTIIKGLRRNLRDNAANPSYIFTESRVGYRMAPPTTPVEGE